MKKWVLDRKNPEKITNLSKELNISPAIAQLLLNRGIDSIEKAHEFFKPQKKGIHNPWLMKDMDIAVERVLYHKEQNNPIMVYGDYDVDGTTSVALMYSFLKSIQVDAQFYIPDRYTEGYGVSEKGIEKAVNEGVKLIISLDCGVKAIRLIEKARNSGIDFIVCDHHRPGAELPPANAVLDPKRADCNYPFKELSGCGVGFKLAQAIVDKLQISEEILNQYLDLVAISIGADLVSITGENRILATLGLQEINKRTRVGIQPLIDKLEEVTIENVVFQIAPKINAAGRIQHAHSAVNMLIEKDVQNAQDLCEKIIQFNETRRDFDEEITEYAWKETQDNQEKYHYTNVVSGAEWHKGVIGIVASRLIEKHYRPTIVFTEKEGKLTGSARSIPGFDLYEALQACSDNIEQFGGHYFAAGLTIKKENLEDFKNQFEKYASRILSEEDLIEKVHLESELNFDDISDNFFNQLAMFEPHGPDNLPPIFGAKNVIDTGWSRKVGKESQHISFAIKQRESKNAFKGIGFGIGESFAQMARTNQFAIAYSIKKNKWRDREEIQLNIKDIKF
ncbi:MAG: single-stranded-DNA-specific exonuclease RecJ [Flavobacteriales bacterium]|jgi:single-stranded-DNA-specific exonuclease|nr:single-stranded-DNA-specific exonuclease RecJ [Flavobacteriales bacterium]